MIKMVLSVTSMFITSPNNLMRSKSSTSSANWHKELLSSALAGRVCVRLIAAILVLFTMSAGIAIAQSPDRQVHSRLDRRIDQLTAQQLLTLPPAKLVDPHRQRAAHQLARFRRPAFFVWVAAQVIALLWLWRSGSAARLRDFLRRRIRNLPAVRFLFGVALGLIAGLAGLPVAFVVYRVVRNAGLTQQHALSWFGDQFVQSILTALAVGTLVAIIMFFVEKRRLWYIYTAAALYLFTLAGAFVQPYLIAPLFNTYTRLPVSSPLYTRLHDVAVKAGVGDAPIYETNLSKQSVSANAFVEGFGATKRIVVGDTLLQTASAGEVAFTLAHEIGHYVRGDVLRGIFVGWIFLVFTCALSVLVADRIGFRSDDDPLARLALVGALLLVSALVVLFPLYNTYSRGVEARADQFAVQTTGDRVSGVRLFVRFADDNLSLVCPSRIVRAYLYDHPPVGSRMAAVRGTPDPCP